MEKSIDDEVKEQEMTMSRQSRETFACNVPDGGLIAAARILTVHQKKQKSSGSLEPHKYKVIKII